METDTLRHLAQESGGYFSAESHHSIHRIAASKEYQHAANGERNTSIHDDVPEENASLLTVALRYLPRHSSCDIKEAASDFSSVFAEIEDLHG